MLGHPIEREENRARREPCDDDAENTGDHLGVGHHQLEERGIHVEKRQVDLPEPIRALGEFRVGIKLHPDVRPEITVTVVKE